MINMLEGILVETLFSIILLFNVGAYSFLWYKIRRVENDVDQNEDSIYSLEETANSLWKRIFGNKDDPTMEGHLVETEDRFDKIDSKLDKIFDRIEKDSKDRRREHQEVRAQVRYLIHKLSEDDNVDIDREDFDLEDVESNKLQ